MAKHVEPSSGQHRRTIGTGKTPSRAPQGSAAAIPHLRGADIYGSTVLFPPRLVVARSQLEHLPEAGRQFFARGLAQVVQRRTTSDAVSVQRKPSALQARAATVLTQLRALIAGADWPTIRKRVYPQQSAAGIARAKDRKSGKATDLTGLGRITSLDRFAGAMKGIQADWPKKTVRERLDAIGAAANAELRQAGVPNFIIVDEMDMVAKGMFSGGDWAFYLNQGLVRSPTLDAATASQVANAAMHESRHAEQHFLAARYSAGFNKTDQAGLVAEQGIPDPIAKEAVKNKFDAMSDMAVALLGQRMFKAFVTNEAASRTAAGQLDPARDEMKDKRTKAESALTSLTTTVTSTAVATAEKARDALSASITAVEKAYASYRAVAYEADAHEVGDAAELAFKGWQ